VYVIRWLYSCKYINIVRYPTLVQVKVHKRSTLFDACTGVRIHTLYVVRCMYRCKYTNMSTTLVVRLNVEVRPQLMCNLMLHPRSTWMVYIFRYAEIFGKIILACVIHYPVPAAQTTNNWQWSSMLYIDLIIYDCLQVNSILCLHNNWNKLMCEFIRDHLKERVIYWWPV